MRKKIYLKGEILNGLEFIKELPERIQPNGKKKRKAIMKCSCGNEFETFLYNVISGITKRCSSCSWQIVGEGNSSHRLIHHKLYKIWADIKKRCYNKKSHSYPHYGGRGITMYLGWIDDFKAFYDYMITLPDYDEKKLGMGGLTIDRMDNNDGYIPGNLRFTNATIQNFNKPIQINNKTGYKGISNRPNGTFQAQIRMNKINNYIGTFKTIDEAVEYRNAFLKSKGIFELYTRYEPIKN